MKRKTTNTAARLDVYQEVTDSIIQLLEAGARPWSPRWANGATSMPFRHHGVSYRGINVLLLWAAAMKKGYTNPFWMTYKQAEELGGQVRKGERGTAIVHAGTFTPQDENGDRPETTEAGDDRKRAYLKRYTVFNVEQIEGLNLDRFPIPQIEIHNRDQRDEQLEADFARYPVPFSEGGDRAFYRQTTDAVHMPAFESFESGNAFYATLAHEFIHSTGHKARLHRSTLADYGKDIKIRAEEELIAEIGAAMLCAQLGMEPTEREDHAAYVASWLGALRGDKRFIFRAATAAQAASEHILEAMYPQQDQAAA